MNECLTYSSFNDINILKYFWPVAMTGMRILVVVLQGSNPGTERYYVYQENVCFSQTIVLRLNGGHFTLLSCNSICLNDFMSSIQPEQYTEYNECGSYIRFNTADEIHFLSR
jgi:hypothetical protein